jgi:uncharacterized protein (DUF1778 family)
LLHKVVGDRVTFTAALITKAASAGSNATVSHFIFGAACARGIMASFTIAATSASAV